MKSKVLCLLLLAASFVSAQEIRRPTVETLAAGDVIPCGGNIIPSGSLGTMNLFYDAGGEATSTSERNSFNLTDTDLHKYSAFPAASGSYGALNLVIYWASPVIVISGTPAVPPVAFSYSLDGGTTWTNILKSTTSETTPVRTIVPLPGTQDLTQLQVSYCMAGGQSDAGGNEYRILTGYDIRTEGNNNRVNFPNISPPPQGFYSSTLITLSTTTVGAAICYTQDGSTPTGNNGGACTHGTTYTVPFSISTTQTINAIATKAGLVDSAMISAPYTFGVVSYTPGAGTYIGQQTVTMSCPPGLPLAPGVDGTIYYTTDGSTPTHNSPSGTAVTLFAGNPVTLQAVCSIPNYPDTALQTQPFYFPLTITTSSCAPGTQYAFSSCPLTVANDALPVSWRLANDSGPLPIGMSIVSDIDQLGSASIQGVPTQSGTFPVKVQVTDDTGSVTTKNLTIAIAFGLSPFANVSTQLSNVASAISPQNSYMQMTLVNCGANVPRLFGQNVLVQPITTFRPNATGRISGQVYGNDVIDCGGTNNSAYSIQFFVNNNQVGPTKLYNVLSGLPFDPSTAVSISPSTPPPPSLFGYIYGNYSANQTIKQPSTSTFTFIFGGTTIAQFSAGGLSLPSGSALTLSGMADGCATFAGGVLGTTGVPCGSGGGGGGSGTVQAGLAGQVYENVLGGTTASPSANIGESAVGPTGGFLYLGTGNSSFAGQLTAPTLHTTTFVASGHVTVPDPTNNTDAANKQYLLAQFVSQFASPPGIGTTTPAPSGAFLAATVANAPANPTDVVNLAALQLNGSVANCGMGTFGQFTSSGITNDIGCATNLSEAAGLLSYLGVAGVASAMFTTTGPGSGQYSYGCQSPISSPAIGGNFVNVVGPATCTSYTWVWPTAVGTAGQVPYIATLVGSVATIGWTNPSGSPGGNPNEFQFNSAGSFGGASGVTWNSVTHTATFGNATQGTIRAFQYNGTQSNTATSGLFNGARGDSFCLRDWNNNGDDCLAIASDDRLYWSSPALINGGLTNAVAFLSDLAVGYDWNPIVKAANYLVVTADFSSPSTLGSWFYLQASTNATITLPATAPAALGCLMLSNTGTGTMTVAPNGVTVDGSSASFTLSQYQFAQICSTTTNYKMAGITSRNSTTAGVTSLTGDGVIFNNSASAGVVTLALATQAQNSILAGSATLAGQTPTFRSLVLGDLPSSVVRTGAANTYTIGLQDFGAVTMRLPVGAGLTTTTNGRVGFDSTNNNFHGAQSSADFLFAMIATGTAVDGNCANFKVTGSNVQLDDAGIPCRKLLFSTPQAVTIASSTGVLGTVTMITPAVDGTYELDFEMSEVSGGSGGTCSAQGAMAVQANWRSADGNASISGSNNVPFIAGNNIAPGASISAASSAGAANTGTSVARRFRAKAGTAITYIPNVQIATNCTTAPVMEIRPALWFLGY